MTNSSVGRTGLLMSAGTLVSRILGFIKSMLLAATIGIYSQGGNAFTQGNQLPNYLYTLTIGGVLTAVLVPQVTNAIRNDSDRGARFINRITTVALIFFALLTVIFTIASPWILKLYTASNWPPELFALAVAFAYWCVPQVMFYALFALTSGVLNAHRVFLPSMWAPALNNVIAIIGLVLFWMMFGTGRVPAAAWTADRIALLAGSATLGVILQAVVLIIYWRKAGLTWKPDFHWRGVGLGSTFKAAGWILGFVVLSGIQSMVQTRILSIPAADTSAVGLTAGAAFENAALLYMLPHSIVAVSIATIYFTRFSEHAVVKDFASFKADFSAGLRSIGLITVLATFVLIVSSPALAALFVHTPVEIKSFALVLCALAPSLPFMSASFLSTRAMYGLGDTRTPFLIQLAKIIWCIPLYFWVGTFDGRWIAVSVAGILLLMCAWDSIILMLCVRRRIGSIDGHRILRSYVRFSLASLLPTVAAAGVMWLLGGFNYGWIVKSQLTAVLGLIPVGIVFLVVYWLCLRVLRVSEVTPLANQLRRKFGRH